MPARPAARLKLAPLERWMQAVVEANGPIERALATPRARAELAPSDLERVVLPSRTLSARERIGVYHGMYLLRMRDALAADYPYLARVLGDSSFRELVQRYVARHPSRSYTFNRLGDRLPGYLSRARSLRDHRFLAELARLELLITEAFDAAETPPLDAEAIARVPPGAWERVRLRPTAALRLGAFRYPVSSVLDRLRESPGATALRPRAKPSYLAVYRRDYQVRRLDMGAPDFALLRALAAGRPLGAAVRSLARSRRHGRGLERRLFAWLRHWTAVGLFAAVEV